MSDNFSCIASIELKGKDCPDLTLGARLKLPFPPRQGDWLHWSAGESIFQMQVVSLSWDLPKEQFWMTLANPETVKPIVASDMLELQNFLGQFGFEDAAAKAEQAGAALDKATSRTTDGIIRDAMGRKPQKIVHATHVPVN